MQNVNKKTTELIDDFVKVKQQLKNCTDMLDVIPDIVYKVDSDGYFVYLNGTIKSIGYSPEELIGKHFSTIIHPDDFASVSRTIVLKKDHKTITGNKSAPKFFDERRTEQRGTKHLPVRLIHKDWKQEENSKIMYVEVMASGQYDKSISKKNKVFLGTLGTIRDMEKQQYIYDGTVGIIRDVTERKIFEQQKVKFEERLQQSRKMEAIGQLAGGVAHNFNNLLMAMQGNISLMLLNTVPPHLYHEKLKNIEKQIQSASTLTSQLLGYARKGKYEIKCLNLNQIVQETSKIFDKTKMGITIRKELDDELFFIKADKDQLQQVMLNLYLNAAEAMPNGGELILKTTNVTRENMKDKQFNSMHGDYVLLTIADTGVGMDKSTMELIFDPFFTTKQMGNGIGLGLASAYGIIKGHGGYTDVKSKKGHGSTFSIYLPASKEKVQKVLTTTNAITRTTKTVFLVDDEDIVLEIEKKLLEASGYKVLTARGGKEAVNVYKQKEDDIDLVLMDMIMPDMGGGETYNQMKKINPHVKVLLSSGYSIDGEAKEILAQGCDGFIQKPCTIKELSMKIREILI